MRFAFFIGCTAPALVPQYETSTRAVLQSLGVDLLDISAFGCCGYPMRNIDRLSFLVSAVRNLALAEQAGLDLLVLCACCFGTLKKARQFLREEPEARAEIARHLGRVGLGLGQEVKIRHVLSVLRHDVGLQALETKVVRLFKGLPLAPHYGCHALRPSDVTNFDDPYKPTIFEDLIAQTGARSVEWDLRLECCGAPLRAVDNELSTTIMNRKIESARSAGARYLCTACPFCQAQFAARATDVEPILYPQLLGLAMGLDPAALGMGSELASRILDTTTSEEGI
ncbi:MAG: disulfide reductase [Deltaproteobacteria bacterium]|nr:disulfide reductase [Deltaproteobacteria bacterium]